MITVIIAGGSGTRLWPLSTSKNPKQLLKLTNERTMVQNTYARAKTFSDTVYVIPDISHADALKSQLPELDEENFIVEPGRRGTANCIVAALAYISKRHDNDEPIAFLSADHHVRDNTGFAQSFKLAGECSTANNSITLVGVEPTHPATGFGYIHKGETVDEEGHVYRVQAFKEKPEFDVAQSYVLSGEYLWNCGYFVGSVNTFVKEMEQFSPKLLQNYKALCKVESQNSEDYKNVYASFESDTIDYALIEKTPNLLVIPAAFDWMDVGNFRDLHEANTSDQSKNYLQGDNIHITELENAYIRNELETPIAVIGLDNIVVVNTKDGILVARKDLSHKVGDIAKKIQG